MRMRIQWCRSPWRNCPGGQCTQGHPGRGSPRPDDVPGELSLGHLEHRRRHSPCDPARMTLPCRSFCRMHRLNGLRVRWPQRRESLAHSARVVGDAFGSGDIWARDLGSWVHGKTGVVDHAFRPSSIRIDSDHRPKFIRMIDCWRFWQTCVRDEQQREQYATDIEKIARQGHLLLHAPVPSAVPKTFPQYPPRLIERLTSIKGGVTHRDIGPASANLESRSPSLP